MAEVIAELCRNHNGDRDVLQRMIREAAVAGATYAKIQSMTPEELTFRQEFEAGDRPYAKELEALRRPA
jgi:N,N'-diacetyllegionaminate synthase